MPYILREHKGKFLVVNPLTNDVKGTHKSKRQALGQMRALYANVPDALNKRRNQVPANSQLWMQAKNEAKIRFSIFPSAYANAWAHAYYRDHGGSWKDVESLPEEIKIDAATSIQKDLRQWVREEWVDISKPIRDMNGITVGFQPCQKPDGESDKAHLRCMPKKRAMKLTEEERLYILRRNKVIPNEEKIAVSNEPIKKYGRYRRNEGG